MTTNVVGKSEIANAVFLTVEVNKLRPGPNISPELRNLMGCRSSALTDPAELTPFAIQLYTVLAPPMVHRVGKTYRVIGNIRTAELAGYLPRGTRIGVMVVPDDFCQLENLHQFSALLASMVEGLNLRSGSAQFLRLWQFTPLATRELISPALKTRSGVARLIGIRRQEKIQPPAVVQSEFKQKTMF